MVPGEPVRLQARRAALSGPSTFMKKMARRCERNLAAASCGPYRKRSGSCLGASYSPPSVEGLVVLLAVAKRAE